MKILVCIKQVVDPDSFLEINADRSWLLENGKLARRMNRYDEYALEEAVLVREHFPGTVVDAVTLGPRSARPVLAKALEKGADRAFHISCEKIPITALTASAGLASFARGREYDMVLTGVLSEDLMQGQTGPMIAARLGWPCAVSVMKQRIDLPEFRIEAQCERDGGWLQTLVLPLPCVLTIQSGINQPRYPSLSNVLRAKNADIPDIPHDQTMDCRSREKNAAFDYPRKGQKGQVLEGGIEEKAERLLDILHEKCLL